MTAWSPSSTPILPMIARRLRERPVALQGAARTWGLYLRRGGVISTAAILGKPNASAYSLSKAKCFDPTPEAARDSGGNGRGPFCALSERLVARCTQPWRARAFAPPHSSRRRVADSGYFEPIYSDL